MPAKNDVYVCNLAQHKLGASLLPGTSLSDVSTVPEVQAYALLLPHNRWLEIKKRRWAFATETVVCTLTEDGTGSDPCFAYGFQMPVGYLKAWRDQTSDWVQRGAMLWRPSAGELRVLATRDVTDVTEMDDDFIEVLACRLAMQRTPKVNQSGPDWDRRVTEYRDAVREAAKNNAFLKPAEDIAGGDEDFDWIVSRV